MKQKSNTNASFEELERLAKTGDPGARAKWIVALERRNDPRFQKMIVFEQQVKACIEQARADLSTRRGLELSKDELEYLERENPEHLKRVCPEVPLQLMARPLRMLLCQDELPRVSYQIAVKSWNHTAYMPDFGGGFSTPILILLFVAQINESEIVCHAGVTQTQSPSPGTTWSALKPWSDRYSKKVKLKRLKAWLESEAGKAAVKIDREVAKVWLESLEQRFDLVVNGRKATKKQLKDIESTHKKKKIDAQHAAEILLRHTGLTKFAELDRRLAADYIACLQSVPVQSAKQI